MAVESMNPIPLEAARLPRPGGVRARGRARPAADPLPAVLPAPEDDHFLRAQVEALASADQAALGRLYDATVGRVYGVALRIVRQPDLAEEVVSEVYLQAWREAGRYDPGRGKVLAWLLIIARSRALDLLRRQDEAFSHPEPHQLVSEPSGENDNPQDLLGATRANRALREALEKLTPMQRQLLSLAFFRGYSHSEIVLHTGVPLGSVKTHIRRALGVLREMLGPQFDKAG